MSLILVVQNVERLDNGLPGRIELNQCGAIIGRSATVTWCLPDPSSHVSSRHAEIAYRGGQYILTDTSTNGTFLNGEPMTQPVAISSGDTISIGSYQILATIVGEAGAGAGGGASAAAPAPQGFSGWDSFGSAAAPPVSEWDTPVSSGSGSAISGTGSMSQSWAPPQVATPAASDGWASTPIADPLSASPQAPKWEQAPPPPPPASPWSSAIADKAQDTKPDDIWGKIAEDYVVDWARGGFGQPPPAPVADFQRPSFVENLPPVDSSLNQIFTPAFEEPKPFGSVAEAMTTPAPAAPPPPAPPVQTVEPAADDDWGSPAAPATDDGWEKTVPPQAQPAAPVIPAAPQPAPPQPAPAPVPQAPRGPDPGYALFIQQLGLNPDDLKGGEAETLQVSAMLLRRLIAGMVVMLEARARAKSQMGAQGTALTFEGNNPLKFARTPDQALLQLMNPQERGFMAPDRAIEDAFVDLQSHQMATLKAMQGALKATLDRFSPNVIRQRAEAKGLMAKIFPDARDAALWKAYEKEFSGVVQGSDEAFMDVFSKEFRKAYEDLTAKKSF